MCSRERFFNGEVINEYQEQFEYDIDCCKTNPNGIWRFQWASCSYNQKYLFCFTFQ